MLNKIRLKSIAKFSNYPIVWKQVIGNKKSCGDESTELGEEYGPGVIYPFSKPKKG